VSAADPAGPTSAGSARLRPVRLAPAEVLLERRDGGAIHLRSPHKLGPYPDKITDRLVHWANVAPDRAFLAQRRPTGEWRKLTYLDTLVQVQAIAQYLLNRKLSAERPIAILSGNDIEHALLALGAMYAGVPYAPISVPYSLMSSDFGKLKSIIEILTPGLVYASDGTMFARAIEAAVPDETEVVTALNPPGFRPITLFSDIVVTEPTDRVEAAHAEVGPDTVAKILFTSGSTGQPKGVINTQRMLTSNQAQIRAGLQFVRDEPPALVDWLPWNHTFGSNHNFNLALDNGGSLYIDEGKPLPGAIAATARNLKEIAPTIYFNVPKGFEALLPFLREDEALRKSFFSKLKGDVLRRRRPAAICLGRAAADERRDHRRAHHLPVQHRLDGDRTGRPRLHLGFRAAGQHRPAAARRRAQACAEGRQARGAAERTEHHTGLLAPPRSQR
jgi:feruloyl-CoA synthase